jgi:multiple sugar transport system substrate-binding protein
MKNMTKKLLSLLFIAATFFCGCEPTAKTGGVVPVKVTFWGGPEEIDIITHSIADWQKEHPEINVIFEHTPYTGYDSKILTRIAGGAAPDIIATEVDQFVTFASKNVLEDLGPFLDQETPGTFSRNEFFPKIFERFTVQGRVLGIPRDVAPFACIFYNKKLFDEAGIAYPTEDWTWDDLLRSARAMTKKDAGGRTVQYGFYGWAWQNFIYGNGGALVDDVRKPTKTLLDDPKTIEGLQFYADLINLYEVMPAPVALANSGMGVDLMFASGRLAMFLSGIWETPNLRNYNFAWDVAMFPKNSKGIRAFGTGGSAYAILKSSKHKKEAWAVVKALTGAKGQEELARRGLAQPSRKDVAQGPYWAGDKNPPANKKMLNEAVNWIVFSPFHPHWREIEEKYLKPKLDLVFNGKKTAAEIARELTPKINELLKEV